MANSLTRAIENHLQKIAPEPGYSKAALDEVLARPPREAAIILQTTESYAKRLAKGGTEPGRKIKNALTSYLKSFGRDLSSTAKGITQGRVVKVRAKFNFGGDRADKERTIRHQTTAKQFKRLSRYALEFGEAAAQAYLFALFTGYTVGEDMPEVQGVWDIELIV